MSHPDLSVRRESVFPSPAVACGSTAQIVQASVCAKPVQTEPGLTMQDAMASDFFHFVLKFAFRQFKLRGHLQEEAHHGEPRSSQAREDHS